MALLDRGLVCTLRLQVAVEDEEVCVGVCIICPVEKVQKTEMRAKTP